MAWQLGGESEMNIMPAVIKALAGLLAVIASLATHQAPSDTQSSIGSGTAVVTSETTGSTSQASEQVDAVGQTAQDVGVLPVVTGSPKRTVAPALPPASADAAPAPPAASATPTSPGARKPGDVLNLSNWKLQLPDGSSGHAYPELASYQDKNFRVNDTGNGIVFRAQVGGSTTPNSNYPRSELREMAGKGEAAWNGTSGTHTLSLTEAVTQLPPVKPQVVTAQIHDSKNDIIEVVADGKRSSAKGKVALCVRYGGKEQQTCLDDNYVLGSQYTVDLTVTNGRIFVFYNGQKKLDFNATGATNTYYFKAGCYTQSNPKKGDSPGAAGEVVIYNAKVTHG